MSHFVNTSNSGKFSSDTVLDYRAIKKTRPLGTALHIQWLWLLPRVSSTNHTVCVNTKLFAVA